MKQEILDVRTLVSIILVIASLVGQKGSSIQSPASGAQNLHFMQPAPSHTNEGITKDKRQSLGEGYDLVVH
ncbi:MAG: hypothetical protein IPL08_03500 [Saprospiraceae bacterium]|nr:hypothetical protein [Saprospiraceae bacterium]MBK8669382.1 hypothetical protein [Saprospiraceae bacterium]MBL0100508.1 hypothetical protein [Saprospiraceae bacterium]